MEKVAVKKLRPGAVMPKFGSKEAAGADLYACLEESVTIAPGQTVFIPTGLAMALPRGYVAAAWPASRIWPLPTRLASSTATTGGNL